MSMSLNSRLVALERRHAPQRRRGELVERELSVDEWAAVLLCADASGYNAELVRRLTSWPPFGFGLGLGMSEEDAGRVAAGATALLRDLGCAYLADGAPAVHADLRAAGFSDDQASAIVSTLRAVFVVGSRHPADPDRCIRREDLAHHPA
jgi:hypothetical protein